MRIQSNIYDRRVAQRGFTLMEALIAMAVMAMIGLLSFGTFTRAIAAREKAEEITSHYNQIRQALQRMATEISMAYISEHRNCEDPATKTIFKSESSSSGMRLDFTSFSHVKTQTDANESDQNEISYFIDSDPENKNEKALMRREAHRIDDEPDEGGSIDLLAANIENLEFEFYDPKEDRWDKDWDTESRDYKNRLPLFVAITLEAKGPGGKDETFVTKTRIVLQESILIAGTGFSKCID